MERIIIDTDPGVDDAQAIMMAAAYPDCKIEAITTVAGNVGLEHTLRNALTITEVLGQDIPVYKGCDRPLVKFQEDAAFAHGSDGLGDCGYTPQRRVAEGEHAVLALIRMINADPGALTLVAIGPLTNVAMAVRLDPDLPNKVKRFIVMGGAVTAQGNTSSVTAEFNIYFDPEAAHIVFEAWGGEGKIVEVADWELTRRHTFPGDVLDRWLSLETDKARFFQNFSARTIERITERYGERMLWGADSLALAVAIEPGIVTRSEKHHLAVELAEGHTRGQTVVDWMDRLGKPANAEIVLAVNHERLLDLLEQAIL